MYVNTRCKLTDRPGAQLEQIIRLHHQRMSPWPVKRVWDLYPAEQCTERRDNPSSTPWELSVRDRGSGNMHHPCGH